MKILCVLPIIGIFVGNIRVMKGNTSVSLGAHFEGYIADRIASGRFNSASEVIRDALREHEIAEKKRYEEWVKYVNAALEESEASGIAVGFDPEKFLDEIHADWEARQQVR